ncbi:sugar ABC transporter permease [Bacillus sp. AFS076308]|uniref:carbohydrate ABC transporter permease n=1 Tax=unclassified Bacillus (in: firmicutes) TaxID=185979 RepID=UPI000BF3FA0C|nr:MULTISPECIES: sugar ABC transporter permease [unclassified Bacillus (in: firmicutes)]PFO09325.1 sugar ABC transporter permease [Bacillus sp. AFS076308]PGV50303.1 sugar ABC transporter permease [Bacillus sp. AFS037270]
MLTNFSSTIEKNKTQIVAVKQKKKRLNKEAIYALLFIAPTFLGLLIFYMLPAVASFVLSFASWDGFTAPVFVGFENIRTLFVDPTFQRSIINTIVFTLVSVPLSVVIATLVSLMLNQKIKGMVLYRTLYFLPVVTMPVAVGMVWKWLYNTDYGLINYLLGVFHLPQPSWLFDPKIALFSVILVYVWMTIGNNVILLLAGLQGVSKSYYEAAQIDGASKFRQFLNITLPLITPTLFFVFITSMISSLQMFDLIFVMIGDNNALLDPLRTIVFGVYESGFKYSQMGIASAQAFLLFLAILAITIIQFIYQKKWVHYDS